jgi:TatD DNase family protein
MSIYQEIKKMNTPYVDIHTHNPVAGRRVISLQNVFLQDYSNFQDYRNPLSVALHPWHLRILMEKDIDKLLSQVLLNKKVIAIGETGIDKKCDVPLLFQKEIFNKHILYAETAGKPVIIHCVGAWDEIIAAKKKCNVPFIIHGYRGNIQNLEMLLKHNCYLSVGESILRDDSVVAEMVKEIPVDRLFLESDDSDIKIKVLYKKLAELKNITKGQLKKDIFANYKTVFGNI